MPLPPDKKTLNPWLLVLIVAGVLIALVAGGIGLATWMVPRSTLVALNEVEMKDGTILRIETVTFGKTHTMMYEWSPSGSPFFWERRRQPVHYGTGSDGLAVFMTRRDKQGRPLDFEWWHGSEIIDDQNDAHSDNNPMVMNLSLYGGTSMHGGERPFRADRSSFSGWLVYSSFPNIRTKDGRFTLRVKNLTDEVVATIDLTHPTPPTASSWTAESLPATKTQGELGVTLNSVRAQHNEWIRNGRPTTSWILHPDMTTTWDGEATQKWQSQLTEVSDELGNIWNGYDRLLSTREAAWRFKVAMFKLPEATFDPSEMRALAHFAVPAADQTSMQTETGKVDGADVALRSISGVGKSSSSHSLTHSRHFGNYSSSSSDNAFGSSYSYEFKMNSGVLSLTVDSALPYFILSTSTLAPLQRMSVKLKDQLGRDIPSHESWLEQNTRLIVFKPESDSTSFDLTAIVHTGREFEFFVKPPELTVPEKKPTN